MKVFDKNIYFCFTMAAVLIVGAFLRLYLLPAQILLDDEWHGIVAVLGNNLATILTSYNPNDNSSQPLNIFNYFIYNYAGFSELGFRLPSIISGIASLIVLPMALKKIFNERVAAVFALLLSISPFLIFYSRFSRAYSLMMLLSFLSLLQSYHWLTTGKRSHAAGYISLGSLAVYVHPFAVVAVVAPLVVASAACFFGAVKINKFSGEIAVTWKQTAVVALIIGILIMVFSWPMLLNSGQLPWARGRMTLEGVSCALTLLSGTANPPSNLLYYLLAAWGLVSLLSRGHQLGWLFVITVPGYLAVLAASRPLGLENGVVMLRYMIVSVPVTLTLVAVAIEDIASRLKRKDDFSALPLLGAGCLAGLLFASGPLPGLYDTPNNFTNHAAFQGSYHTMNWNRSDAHEIYPAFSVSPQDVSPFYFRLKDRSDVRTIVEYPFDVCDYNDLFYYFQHFHQKKVVAGYCSDSAILGYSQSNSSNVGRLSIDDILEGVPRTKLSARNIIDVADPTSLAKGEVDMVVFHKYLMAPDLSREQRGFVKVDYLSIPVLKLRYQSVFGRPIYEDNQIVCFSVRSKVK
jgi:hypothetical protein